MRKDIYHRLVYLINRHRTWVEVVSADAVRTHTIIRNGILRGILCRMLVLRAFDSQYPYERGMEWRITQGDVFHAIRWLRSADTDFNERISKNPSFMTKADAERIIFLATQGIVKLRLSDIPIYTISSL